jgi:hypothetical protein
MVAEVEPAELARLLDTAERPRAQNWSLRAAVTRYAQPQPQRSSDVIELLRRTESALRPHSKLFEREGPVVWRAVQADGDGDSDSDSDSDSDAIDPFVVELLRALVELDRLGDVLADWAVDRAVGRPDATVDAVVADVTARLERLGVQREERPRPTGGRRG